MFLFVTEDVVGVRVGGGLRRSNFALGIVFFRGSTGRNSLSEGRDVENQPMMVLAAHPKEVISPQKAPKPAQIRHFLRLERRVDELRSTPRPRGRARFWGVCDWDCRCSSSVLFPVSRQPPAHSPSSASREEACPSPRSSSTLCRTLSDPGTHFPLALASCSHSFARGAHGGEWK